MYQHEHLIMGLSFALANSAHVNRSVNDRDLIAALTSLAQSYETLVNSGLVYETPTANVVQQSISAEVQKMVKEFREAEQKHTGMTRLKDAEVLLALVFLLRMAHARSSGRPKSRAFVDFLFSQFPERKAVIAPEEARSRIITP